MDNHPKFSKSRNLEQHSRSLHKLIFRFILLQIFLAPKERNNTEYKLETFSGVYRKLSGKDVVFEYPTTEA